MDKFMKTALHEARLGFEEGGVPIGAALVSNGKLIATGRNRRVQDGAPIMHGEMTCLYNAGERILNSTDLTLYSTLMPCYMCAGAIVQFGINKVVVAEGTTANEGLDMMLQHGVEVTNLNISEPREMLAKFIETDGNQWYSHPPK